MLFKSNAQASAHGLLAGYTNTSGAHAVGGLLLNSIHNPPLLVGCTPHNGLTSRPPHPLRVPIWPTPGRCRSKMIRKLFPNHLICLNGRVEPVSSLTCPFCAQSPKVGWDGGRGSGGGGLWACTGLLHQKQASDTTTMQQASTSSVHFVDHQGKVALREM